MAAAMGYLLVLMLVTGSPPGKARGQCGGISTVLMM
jgi:hypothetical protein